MNFNSINTSSIPYTLNEIEEGVGFLLSTGLIDSETIRSYTTTLTSIKNFIANKTEKFFKLDLNPIALNDQAMRLSELIDDLQAIATGDDKFDNEPEIIDQETTAAIAKLEEEEAAEKERRFLVQQQDFHYAQSVRLDLNNNRFRTIETEKKTQLDEILTQFSTSDIKRFKGLRMLYKEVKAIIKTNRLENRLSGKDIVFTKENTIELVRSIVTAYESSYQQLCQQAKMEEPECEKYDRLGKLEVMVEIGNLDDVNKAFNELFNEEQTELATLLGYPSIVFRTLPGAKSTPFTGWEFSGTKYNPDAIIAALNEMKPKSAFASYIFHSENGEFIKRKIKHMTLYLNPNAFSKSPTASSSSQAEEVEVEAAPAAQKSHQNLFLLLDSINGGDAAIINNAFTKLDKEEQKSLTTALGFSPNMLIHPQTPFTKWRTRTASYHPDKTIDALNSLIGLASSVEVDFEDDGSMSGLGFDEDGFFTP